MLEVFKPFRLMTSIIWPKDLTPCFFEAFRKLSL